MLVLFREGEVEIKNTEKDRMSNEILMTRIKEIKK